QLNAIEADLMAIGQNLSMIQTDLTISELAESRKLNEIEAEDPSRAVSLDLRDWNQLAYRVGVVAVVLAILTVFGAFGTVMTDTLLHGAAWPHGAKKFFAYGIWAFPIIVIIAAVLYLRGHV